MHKTPFFSRPTPLVLALSIAYAGTFLAMPMRVQAQSVGPVATTLSYTIEKGPLAQALLSISRQSGRKIVFDPASVASLIASPVKGSLSTEDAIRAALQGTGLVLVVKADGVLAVGASVANTAAPAAPVTTLKAITVLAERDQAETSFKVDRSSTSTRSDTDLMDVPGSVTVITSKVLESQQATSLKDAIRQVAGVIYTESFQGPSSFSIRGFGRTSVLSNGLASSAASDANIAGIERIEVLKGPQAILSGAGALGGSVNIVTKKPQAETLRELTAQYGSYGDMVLAGDLSGALSEDQRLSYRLIASGENQSKNYADYNGNHVAYLMPQLRWKDDSTDLIVGYSTDSRRSAPPAYTFAYRGSVQETPEQRLGNSADGVKTDTQNYFYTLSRKISSDVSFTSKMQRTENQFSLRMYSPLGLQGPDTIYYSRSPQKSETQTNAGDHYFEFKLKSGPISHKLTVGFSHENNNYSQREYDGGPGVLVQPYGSAYPFAAVDGTLSSILTMRSKQLGGYALDLMSWQDFSLLLGARRTKYQSDSSVQYPSLGETTVTPAEATWETTPTVGVVYRVTPSISAYANYVKGFDPQIGNIMCNGGASPPTRTTNKEAGLKFDLLDSKLSVTTSVFNLHQLNVLSMDLATNCYTALPGQTTKGVELDLAGEVSKGLNLLLNATYSKISDTQGLILEYAARPTQRASLWLTYDFQSKMMHGWGAGLGVTANNKSYLDFKFKTSTTEPVVLPGSARVDANVSYREKNWSVTLGVKNLFDRDLYGFSTATTYVPLEPPRTATLTYKATF